MFIKDQEDFLRDFTEQEIGQILIDSRKTVAQTPALFCAIKTPTRDGHDFLGEALEKGCTHFLITTKNIEKAKSFRLPGVYAVENVVKSLQLFASRRRNTFRGTVLGITGSNGKTIVKEWLAFILSQDKRLLKSPASYNSQIGVPLSVAPLNNSFELAIFEAGISLPGEMEVLEQIIKPDLGILTTIGSAHDAGFESRQQKVMEKLNLFKHCKQLIAPRLIFEQYRHTFESCLSSAVELLLWEGHQDKDAITYTLGSRQIRLPLSNRTQAELQNMGTLVAVLWTLGYHNDQFEHKLTSLPTVEMRLAIKNGRQHSVLIDDTYNNDVNGLRAALETMDQWAGSRKKVLILSAPSQETTLELEELAKLFGQHHIDEIIGLGEELESLAAHTPISFVHYPTTQHFLDQLHIHDFSTACILLKGARKYALEKVVAVLEEKTHSTHLKIDLNALRFNLKQLRAMVPNTKIMAMVKAFGYGSGDHQVATLLQHERIDYLAVAYTDEAIGLRERGIHVPILITNASQWQPEVWLSYQLEPVLHSLVAWQKAKQIPGLKVHLEVDTGMNRLGFKGREWNEVQRDIKEQIPACTIVGLMTHLAAADIPREDGFTKGQLDEFERATRDLEEVYGKPVVCHALNSAGMMRFPERSFDMVRPGIALYGIAPSPMRTTIQPVLHFNTTVSQVKQVSKGESVGYGRSWIAEKEATIAIIAGGYADGIPRALSNGVGKVWVGGEKRPIVGKVCMDMTMVEVSGLPVKEGDHVEIFGEHIDVEEQAKAANTIAYELIASIPQRVNRIYTGDY